MGTVTVLTAERMRAIEASSIVSGLVDIHGNLILTNFGGDDINAGVVKGDKGDTGSPGADGTDGADFIIAAGLIQPYAGSIPPTGWMFCNGDIISRTTYSELFAAIGTTYGAGNGVTTFQLPDLRGKALVGLDATQTEFNAVGKTGGEKTHQLTAQELAMHGHEFGGDDGMGSNGLYTRRSNFAYDATSVNSGNGGNFATRGMLPDSNSNATFILGNQPHNNLQPYSVTNYIISLGVNGPLPGGTPITINYRAQGTTAERDALYGVPSTTAQKVALANQKPVWFNVDLGWEESYYADTSFAGLTVLGLLTGTASGWYPTGLGPEGLWQPGATGFSLTSGTGVGGWTGGPVLLKGASFFSHDGTSVTAVKAGIYDFWAWTNQQTGSGLAEYRLRRLTSAGATIMDRPLTGSPLSASYWTQVDGSFETPMNAGDKIYLLCLNGSLAVHQGGDVSNFVRAQMRLRYLRPLLVTE